MSLFKHSSKAEEVEVNSVEIIAHQKATKRQINKVRNVNAKLNDLLEHNGFTFNLVLALGGKANGKLPRTEEIKLKHRKTY